MSNNLLKGKRGIIFGALNEQSIAWKVAERAVEEGATITLSNTPVAVRMGTVSALAEKLNCEVIAADATSVEDLENVFNRSVEILGGKIALYRYVTKCSQAPYIRRLGLQYARHDARYFGYVVPQDDSEREEARRYQRVWLNLGFVVHCCTAYILRLQRYG